MKRKLFHFASTLSLLLCLATAILWVRSYSWHDVELYAVSVDHPVLKIMGVGAAR